MHQKPDPRVLPTSDEILSIWDSAIRGAVEENRRLGVPSVFFRDGKRVYEMPDGSITEENPFANDPPPQRPHGS